MGNKYTLSAYKSGSTVIKGISAFDISPNVNQMLLGGSGAIDNGFAAIGSAAPQIGFTTSAIKTALALAGIKGVAMSSDTFYFIKYADGGARDTANHQKIVVAKGILVPLSVNATQGAGATIGYRAHAMSADGAASPFVITTSATIETGQDIISEVYTMGPVSINGTQLSGVTQWSLDFGIQVFAEICDGDVYPQFSSVIARTPTVRITCYDVDQFATWSITGAAQGTTDSTLQLLSQTAGGVRGAAPITFSIDDGLITTENITGNQGQVLGHQIIITPVSDGTNDVIAITGLT